MKAINKNVANSKLNEIINKWNEIRKYERGTYFAGLISGIIIGFCVGKLI